MVALVGRTGGTPVTVVVAVVDVEVVAGVEKTTVLVDDVEVAAGVVVMTVVLTIDVLGTITTGTEEVLIRVEEGVTMTVELKTPVLNQFPFRISEV
jgi:hypothetical protein